MVVGNIKVEESYYNFFYEGNSDSDKISEFEKVKLTEYIGFLGGVDEN